ncbi:MAG: type IV pilus modification protein PilV [Gammaproteobacteria bacterium]
MNSPARTGRPIRSRVRGFTLIEVMVALVITAIGLLGIAKIQALAYASTGSAGVRSLVALQAAGLAASMHANRTYWSGLAPPSIVITDTTISDATLNAAAATVDFCKAGNGNTPCNNATLAAADLHAYATTLNTLLQNLNPVTTITCPAFAPVSCTIQVTWNEHAVSVNKESAAVTTQTTFAPTYMLYVEP